MSAKTLTAEPPETSTARPLSNWAAKLDLCFSQEADRTQVQRRHVGPLLMQRPFYPEDDGTCHVYILHPPGGITQGDTLDLSISLGAHARAVLTAPGAAKFLRSPRQMSRVRTSIMVEAGGVCELLPPETIVFNGAHGSTEVEISLAEDATFVGWDIVSLGRPATSERFENGSFAQRMTIRRESRPIWFERTCYEGGAPILDAPYGLQGHPIQGTMLCCAKDLPTEAVDILRNQLKPPRSGTGAITQLNDALVLRYAGPKGAAAQIFFVEAWGILRRLTQGKPAICPRIWST